MIDFINEKFYEFNLWLKETINIDGIFKGFYDNVLGELPELIKVIILVFLAFLIVLGLIAFIKKFLKIFVVLVLVLIICVAIWHFSS